jgi:metal-responsive CopG/Arc/MetJ family transcriptional regulator
MRLQKRTYALPPETVREFDEAVQPGRRSTVVADLMQSWLDERRRARLREAVIEGCKEMADLYLEIEREYHPLEEEVERVLDAEG